MSHKRESRIPRRGIAMLLVLISLTLATVLAVSYLASRDNSAAIGENICNAATARAGAAAGLEIGVAILETDSDWRTNHTNGKLLDDFPIGEAEIDLDIWDIGHNREPDHNTSLVRVTCTSRVGDIEQVTTGIVRTLGVASDGALDVDLSDFAIFSEGIVELTDMTTLTRWPVAPLSGIGRRVAIGTRAEDASSVSVGPWAAAIDATVYHTASASDNVVSVANTMVVEEIEVLDGMPSPTPAQPPVVPPDSDTPYPAMLYEFGSVSLDSDTRASQIDFNEETVTLSNDMTLVSDGSINLGPGTLLRIEGHVTIVAFLDLNLDNAAIELTNPTDTLEIYVFDKLSLLNSYIGEQRSDDIRDVSGTAPWMDPQRMQVIGLAPTTAANWEWNGDSVVKASIYAPHVQFHLHDSTALYGRVAAGRVKLHSQSSIFYDHSLDSGYGYTNTESPLYLDDGHLHPGLLALPSFEPAPLTLLADDVGYSIECNGERYDYAGDPLPPPPPLPPGQPTPRPVRVEFDVEATGIDVVALEGIVG